MKILKIIDEPNKTLSNILLFSIAFIFIFLTSLIPDGWTVFVNNILFSILFFIGIYALNHVKKEFLIFAVIAFLAQWIAVFFKFEVLEIISYLVNIIFFQLIIIRLIIQIAKSREVTTQVIFESINGYLLMGIMFSSWLAVLMFFYPEAFNGMGKGNIYIQDIFYFTFVTMTTLGYGEITPQIPVAKSLSILISTSGQLYIAILIALLVGKFSSSQQKNG